MRSIQGARDWRSKKPHDFLTSLNAQYDTVIQLADQNITTKVEMLMWGKKDQCIYEPVIFIGKRKKEKKNVKLSQFYRGVWTGKNKNKIKIWPDLI